MFTVYLNSDSTRERSYDSSNCREKALIKLCALLQGSTPRETEKQILQCVIRYKLQSKIFITSSDVSCIGTELRPTINSDKSLNHETQMH